MLFLVQTCGLLMWSSAATSCPLAPCWWLVYNMDYITMWYSSRWLWSSSECRWFLTRPISAFPISQNYVNQAFIATLASARQQRGRKLHLSELEHHQRHESAWRWKAKGAVGIPSRCSCKRRREKEMIHRRVQAAALQWRSKLFPNRLLKDIS